MNIKSRNKFLNKAHGANAKDVIKAYGFSPAKIIDFSENINPLGMPKKIRKSIKKSFDLIEHYPQPNAETLVEKLALYHQVRLQNIFVGNGSIEILHILPRALNIKRAVVVGPTFSEYENALLKYKAKVYFCNTYDFGNDKFYLSVKSLESKLKYADIVFLGNPNNPTSSLLDCEKLEKLLFLCKKYKVFLLIDEVFIDFLQDGHNLSMLKNVLRNKFLLVLRSFTKFFALAGIRIGYLVSNSSIVNKVAYFSYPWNVNALALDIAQKVLKDSSYMVKSKEFVAREREYLKKNLSQIKTLKTYPAFANFILCKLKDGRIKTATKLYKELLRYGIVIRDCSNFRGLDETFFRVAVKNRKDDIKLISTLKEVLK